MKQATLRMFGLIGGLLFIPLFLLTFANPHAIERAGQAFISWKLTTASAAKIEAIKIPTSNKFGAFLASKAESKISTLKQKLKEGLPAIIAAEMAKMQDLSCSCRHKWERRIAASINIQIATLEMAKVKIAEFSQAKYMEIVNKLINDVRIFLGVNSVVFILLPV